MNISSQSLDLINHSLLVLQIITCPIAHINHYSLYLNHVLLYLWPRDTFRFLHNFLYISIRHYICKIDGNCGICAGGLNLTIHSLKLPTVEDHLNTNSLHKYRMVPNAVPTSNKYRKLNFLHFSKLIKNQIWTYKRWHVISFHFNFRKTWQRISICLKVWVIPVQIPKIVPSIGWSWGAMGILWRKIG